MDITDPESDTDSGLGTNQNTASLTQGSLTHEYENGRRYHAYRQGTYVLPNDEPEQDRLDIWHQIELLYQNFALTAAPLHLPSRILDVGSGTGAWAYDMADTHPSATITGLDLSPASPKHWHPRCHFEVDDAEDSWSTYPSDFDLVHIRYMMGSICNWERLLGQAWEHTRPGGWIEIIESPLALYSSAPMPPNMAAYFSHLNRGFTMLHRPSNPDIEDIRRMMERVGWVDVEVRVGCVPVGACSRARGSERLEVVGRLALSAIVLGFPSYGTALFTRVLGWEFEDAERLFEACRRELEGMEDCWSERWHFLGRKPEADSWDGLVGGVGGLVIDEKMRD